MPRDYEDTDVTKFDRLFAEDAPRADSPDLLRVAPGLVPSNATFASKELNTGRKAVSDRFIRTPDIRSKGLSGGLGLQGGSLGGGPSLRERGFGSTSPEEGDRFTGSSTGRPLSVSSQGYSDAGYTETEGVYTGPMNIGAGGDGGSISGATPTTDAAGNTIGSDSNALSAQIGQQMGESVFGNAFSAKSAVRGGISAASALSSGASLTQVGQGLAQNAVSSLGLLSPIGLLGLANTVGSGIVSGSATQSAAGNVNAAGNDISQTGGIAAVGQQAVMEANPLGLAQMAGRAIGIGQSNTSLAQQAINHEITAMMPEDPRSPNPMLHASTTTTSPTPTSTNVMSNFSPTGVNMGATSPTSNQGDPVSGNFGQAGLSSPGVGGAASSASEGAPTGPGGNVGEGVGGGAGAGACVVGTEMAIERIWRRRDLALTERWCQNTLHNTVIGESMRRGYRWYGRKVVKMMRKSQRFAKLAGWFFRKFSEDRTGKNPSIAGKAIYYAFGMLGGIIGMFARRS